jgi:AcrR family transcriptional regulator
MSHEPPRPPLGLRERKRAETRQRIAGIATMLFATRGFDAVTVAEVAAAADVSKVTVFNYFPRKEDMLFDRAPEAAALIIDAVQDRGPDRTPVAAVRDLVLDLVARGHPLTGIGPNYDGFLRIVRESPTLVARVREIIDELEDGLAQLFAAAGGPLAGAEPPAPHPAGPALAAALVIRACRAVYREFVRRQAAGEPAGELAAPYAAALRDALDRAELAIRGGPSPAGVQPTG